MKYTVWYMKTAFFQEGIMGYDWMTKHNTLPDPTNLIKTHTPVAVIEANGLEDVFGKMQAERWSPKGEAIPLIEALDLGHTSMSVGDIAVNGEEVHIVDNSGYKRLG